MLYSFVNGHGLPSDELSLHLAMDFCECKPVPVYTPDGQIWWRHNCINREWTQAEELALLGQAEAIRMAESVSLWAQAESSGVKKLKIVPFMSMNPIHLPPSSHR